MLSFLITFLSGAMFLHGQDPGGTQFINTPLYYNPAYTGLTSGLHARFSTRNQGPALETSFRAYHFSADIATRNLPGSGGIGLILKTDNEGVGFIKNYNLGVSFSARVPLSNYILGQVGIKIAWLHKHIAWDDFIMTEEIHDKYGNIYDSVYMQPVADALNMPDFAIGGLARFINKNGCLSGTLGLAVDHLFEPDESFLETAMAPLPRKWIGHADVIWRVKCNNGTRAAQDKATKFNPGIVYQHQGESNAIQAGLSATRYDLYLGIWYKGEFGAYNSNSLAVSGGYRYVFAANTSIKFTYSYDIPLSGSSVSAGGAHEISIVLEFNNINLFKSSGGSSTRYMTPDGIDARLARLAF